MSAVRWDGVAKRWLRGPPLAAATGDERGQALLLGPRPATGRAGRPHRVERYWSLAPLERTVQTPSVAPTSEIDK